MRFQKQLSPVERFPIISCDLEELARLLESKIHPPPIRAECQAAGLVVMIHAFIPCLQNCVILTGSDIAGK